MSPVLYHDGRFPPRELDLARLLPSIGPAHAAVARYAGLLQSIAGPDVLLSPMTTQEAVLTSRIEGTQATMGEVLEAEAEGNLPDESGAKGGDIREILNYRAALHEAVRLSQSLPLSQRLLKEAHRVLMQGVRGASKDPGEYRRISNWIGPAGLGREYARFVPVSAEHLSAAMSVWEKYLHAEPEHDVLIQLAVLHAEFEAIHPFLDGNGRIGRLFIPLFMADKQLLAGPHFYLSEYLEKRRDEYYERLLAVSRDDNWTDWCIFFLTALRAQAEQNQQRVTDILALYNRQKQLLMEVARSQYAVPALDFMFRQPIFRSSTFQEATKIPQPSVNRLLKLCRDNGILSVLQAGGGRRPATYCLPDLLNIAEGRHVFGGAAHKVPFHE